MLDLLVYIEEAFDTEQLILERNEKIFPQDNKRSKMEIWVGDHARQRQEERKVSTQDIISAFFAAYADLGKKFKEGEFSANKDPRSTRDILIVDTRKNKENPLTISCWLYRNRGTNKLQYPMFTVKTVYWGVGGAMKSDEKALKIFIY